ncbi:HlyD family type I secretion periplasmic adaptor subunit [Pelagibacterium sediminicola]|uniref:HlyD family type I secretion periplasmic adaptor subunit n=1 Tax=Pelagibacterium sediminicola TaxID=2248761 RepID=UPI000E322A53|nr:HlyD family type I secretion periplasmic adaptor subunit [Pelagibacterium sediminicola]
MSNPVYQTGFSRMDIDPVEKMFSLRARVIWGVILAILLLGGVFGWAGMAKLSGAVIGVGTVLVDDDIKVVQHPDGGVLREILVREGDEVAAGQVLMRLEDAEIAAEKAILEGQLIELLARRARLAAEAMGIEAIDFPEALSPGRPGVSAIAAGERQLFAGDLARHRSQRNQLLLQVDQLNEEINGLEFQRTATIAESELAQSELERLRQLAQSNLIEASRVTTAERDIIRLQGQTGNLDTGIARAQVRISDVELQVLQLDGTRQTEAQRQLGVVEAQIAELEERLSASVARYARTVILAPVAGTINELNVTTVGGVISPAERLVTIVPDDADLVIEFRVAINDIDQVNVGGAAILRFVAFNQRTTPEVRGDILRVSAASQQDSQTGERFYLAQVEVDHDSMAFDPSQLVPGMPVEVFVETEQQTAIAYFMKPFTDQIARAFREE